MRPSHHQVARQVYTALAPPVADQVVDGADLRIGEIAYTRTQ